MTTLRNCAMLMLLPVMIAGCSAVNYEVHVDRDPGMGRHATWAWHPRGNRVAIVEPRRAGDAHERIKAAVAQALAAKGVQLAAQGSPQVLVAFDLGAVQRTQVTEWAETNFMGRATSTPTATRQVRQGTLIVYLIDAGTNRLVWRGRADATVENPDDAASRINEIVARMFADYP